MRFRVNLDNEEARPALRVLDLFLNEHLIGRHYGPGMSAIFVTLVENPRKRKKFRKRLLYGKYGEIEVPFERPNDAVEELERAFEAVADAVRLAGEIPLKTQGFQHDALSRDFARLRPLLPNNEGELDRYIAESAAIRQGYLARLARMEQDLRRAAHRPLTKPLKGVRIFALGECDALDLGAAAFAETYGNLLRGAEILTPGYSEIYIQVASSIEEALGECALEPWYECTPAAVDPEAFESAPTDTRVGLLAKIYGDALRSIAEIDHLDATRLAPVLAEVENNGLDRDLVASSKQSRKYKADIVYNVVHFGEDGLIPYRLRITCLASGDSGEKELARFHPWDAAYNLSKITLTNTEVRVRARTSFRAELALKAQGLPSEYRFTVREVLESSPSPVVTGTQVLARRSGLPLNRRP